MSGQLIKTSIIGIIALFFLFPGIQYGDETLCYTERVTDAPSFNIYTGKDDANNPIVWSHNVPAGILDSVVRVGLYIEAFDVDYPADSEHDRVSINGYDLGILEGFNDTWITVEKTVPVEALREGINDMKVVVDELRDGWKVSIRASELRFYCSGAEPDFSIGTVPVSQEIVQGQSTAYTVNLTGLNGFSSPVTFSITGLPTGAAGTFSVNPLTPAPTGVSVLNIDTTTAVAVGVHTLTITGEGGGKVHTKTVTLTVNENTVQPDFSIEVTPTTQEVIQGESTTYTVKLTALDGFDSPVALSISGLPTGTGGVFSINPLTPTGESVLNVTTSDSAALGNHTLTITAEGGGKSHTAEAVLTINEKTEKADFTITADPLTRTVFQGGSTDYKIKLESLNGFSQKVKLSIDGLPNGATAEFQPKKVLPTGESELTITTTETIPVGSYKLTVTGKSDGDGRRRSVEITLKVEQRPPDPDFTIQTSPESRTILRGATADYTIKLSALNGFDDEVKLNVDALPGGITAQFDPDALTPDGESVLQVTTTSETAIGTHTFTVTGISGSLEHSVTLTLILACPLFDVNVKADPLRGPSPLTVQFESLLNIQEQGTFTVSDYTLRWDFGDGNTSDESNPEHTFQASGSYHVVLTATDPCGQVKTASKEIEVEAFEGTITKQFSAAEAQPGDEVFITIEAKNGTRMDFDTITIRDELSPYLEYLDTEGTEKPRRSGQNLVWEFPHLKKGQTSTLKIKVKVTDEAPLGTITNVAYLSHESLNRPIASNTAALTINKIDVSLQKHVDKPQAQPGDPVTYTIIVKNNSSIPLSGITLTDELSSHLQFRVQSSPFDFSKQGRKLQWTGIVESGDQAVITIKAAVASTVFSGTVVENTAKMEAAELKEAIESNTVHTSVSSDPVSTGKVRFTKRSEVPQTEVGRIIRFNITVVNNSHSPLLSPVIEDNLPQGFNYVAETTLLNIERFDEPQGKRHLIWQLPTINAGETVILRYQVVIGTDAKRGRNVNHAVLRAADNSGQDLYYEASAYVNVSAAGFIFYSSVDGTVYIDRDYDDFYSPSDTPLEGIEVRMSTGEKALTDSTGHYSFESLFAGEYALGVNTATLPEKYKPASPFPTVVVLSDGLSDTVDFAILFQGEDVEQSARLEGRVFFDKNQNQVFDGDDPLAKEFKVTMANKITNGTDGKFVFTHLKPGPYTLEIRYGPKVIQKTVTLNDGKNNIDIPLPFSGIKIIVSGEER